MDRYQLVDLIKRIASQYPDDKNITLLASDGLDQIQQLISLDNQYGRVEAAIIKADAEFDGNSDHATCADRLISSIQKLALK